jgi:S-methylmethionine-dependent homocysteine/selenocysteine methylase
MFSKKLIFAINNFLIGCPMAKYRNALPQLSGDLFLLDAGLETDLIFNHDIDIPEFASHTLLPDPKGREAMVNYYREFLTLAATTGAGFLLGVPIWKAHMHWAKDLGASEADLRQANHDSVAFVSELRDEFSENAKPILLDAVIGPRGDAYAPDEAVAVDEAERYHAKQIGWLAVTEVDIVTGLTFTQSDEAIGFVRAARSAGLPSVMSFTVETDGKLPTGQPLGEAIRAVDDATDQAAAYFMVNCAHPDHFSHVLDDETWTRRILGIRCNASRLSHAELDACEVLDDGDPVELGGQYREFKDRMPWLNIFGGCCGSDLRHVTQIAKALAA